MKEMTELKTKLAAVRTMSHNLTVALRSANSECCLMMDKAKSEQTQILAQLTSSRCVELLRAADQLDTEVEQLCHDHNIGITD